MDSWTLRAKLASITGRFSWTDVPMFEVDIELDRQKAQAQNHFKYKNKSILFYGSLNE